MREGSNNINRRGGRTEEGTEEEEIINRRGEYSIRYNNSICIIIYNSICIRYNNNITPHVNTSSKARTRTTSTKHKHQLQQDSQPDTIPAITPQPSTPIKHAGSRLFLNIGKRKIELKIDCEEEKGRMIDR